MYIAETTPERKNIEFANGGTFSSGNVILHWWYSKILTISNKADTIAICLLSELWFLYRSTCQEEHQKDYSFFCTKFNLSQFQIREGFIRLETIGLMTRSIGNIIVNDRTFANILFVTLHVKQLLAMSSKSSRSKASDDNDHKGIFFDNRLSDSEEIESDISEANRCKRKEEEKPRSNESDFNSSNFLSEEAPATTIVHRKRFSLASFYPLMESDIDNLQSLCGREFPGNAVNEILLSLSKKLPNHSFPHKKAFIKYMAKALAFEMRYAVKIGNESFRIKASTTSEELIIQERKKFLSKIEESNDTSRKMQLSRKLAGVLEPSIVYRFLLSASLPEEVTSLKSKTFKICLQTTIKLSDPQYRLILEQVQSVYGNHINSPEFTISARVKGIEQSSNPTQDAPTMFDGVWGRIRQDLIDYYGLDGNAMDSVWFAKLKADVDPDAKKLTLKAPTKFIKEWVQSNYSHLIDKLSRLHSYSLEEVIAI